jgi:uncharacterized membrane protein
MKLLYTLILTVPCIAAIDLVWLGFFAKQFYQSQMSPIVTIEFNWLYVALFYICYIIGLTIFVLKPGIEAQSLSKTLTLAALFGFFCYMTYDLTNMATIKNWPLSLAVVDMAWGVVITTVTAYIAYSIYFLLP